MSERAAALEVRVRLLPDPWLWCWELVDPLRRDAPVDSSWAGEWAAYASPEEAFAAGCVRLVELRCARAGGRVSGRRHGKGESAA
jgi:hypothetical protein